MQFAPAHENLQRFHLSHLFWVPLLDVIKNLLKGLRKNSTGGPVACGVPSHRLDQGALRKELEFARAQSFDLQDAEIALKASPDAAWWPDGLGATFDDDDDGVLFVHCRFDL